MAVAGGATSAYKCQVQDGELVIRSATALRSECVEPEEAIPLLGRGEWVTVAGSDMAELRKRLGVGQSEDTGGER